MKHSTAIPIIAFVAFAVAGAGAFQAPAPVRSPADELKTIVTQPGYRLELVASEPLAGCGWSR